MTSTHDAVQSIGTRLVDINRRIVQHRAVWNYATERFKKTAASAASAFVFAIRTYEIPKQCIEDKKFIKPHCNAIEPFPDFE
jgi:hypothetical protein